MFLWIGFGVFVLVLALCIDTIDTPSISAEQVARIRQCRDRMKATMKITLKTAHGYLSAQPAAPGGTARWQYRKEAGAWETFDLDGFEFPLPPAPPVPPTPPVDTWPPPTGTHPQKPPNIVTVDVEECRKRVRWGLWNWQSDDDESYWMKAIVLDPEPGHTPGWVIDDYWYDKIKVGDGVGKGYVWPAR